MRTRNRRLTALGLTLTTALILGGCGSSSPQSQLKKAQTEAAAGKERTALIMLRSLVQKHPDFAQGRIALGTLLLKLGDPGAAAAQLEQAQRLSKTPASVELPLAQALIQTGHMKRALTVLQPDKTQSAAFQAELFTARAQAEIALQQYDQANQSLAKALANNPHLASAIAEQGALALQQKQPDAALQKASQALAIDPHDGLALLIKGAVLDQQQQFAEAVASFKQALATGSPQLSPSQMFLVRGRIAQAQIRLNQFQAALGYVDAMLKQAPKQPIANYLRGLLAYQAKDYATAVQHLQTTLDATPDNVQALTLLGSAEAAQGHDVLATNYLNSALAQEPHDPAARHLLAALQMREGQGQQAIGTLASGGTPISSGEILALFTSPAKAVQALIPLQTQIQDPAQHAAIDLALAHAFLAQGNSRQALTTLGGVKASGNTALETKRLEAAAYLRDGNKAKAIDIANAIAKDRPHDVDALHAASIILLAAGQNREAETVLKQAEKVAPLDVSTTNALGALLLREGDYSGANSAFQRTLSHAPKNLVAQMILARIAAVQGHSTEAIGWLQKAHQTNPDALAPLTQLTQYQETLGHPRQAVSTAEAAVRLSNNAPNTLVALGRAQLAADQGTQALSSFRAAAAAAPQDPRYGLFVATAQLALKQPKPAQATLTQLVATHPEYLAAVRALALVQLHNGHAKAAFATVEKLAALPHDKAVADLFKGDLYSTQNDFKSAQLAYAQSFQQTPTRQAALKDFGAAARLHQTDAAQPLLTWLKSHPDDSVVRTNLADYYQQQGEDNKAETAYREALKYTPNAAVILNNLAWLLFQHKDPGAIALAKKAYALSPNTAPIADTYGWLLTESGHAVQALPILQKAASGKVLQPTIGYHYAVALSKDGKSAEARKELSLILKAPKAFPEREQAKSLMRSLNAAG